MAESSTPASLDRVIRQLQKQRDGHVAAIADIDQAFARFGIKPGRGRGKKRGPGRPVGSGKKKTSKKVAKKRKRGRFKQTADKFVLGLLTGGKQLSTRDINNRWKRARRGGSADKTLLKLVKDKQLKREKNTAGRGSNYSLA